MALTSFGRSDAARQIEKKKKGTSDCASAFPGKEMSWVTVATGITNRQP